MVAEIPSPFFQSGKTYVFFSHTIKGQPYNMAMLRRLMELECNSSTASASPMGMAKG